MSNPSKNKGTAAETAVLRWVREHGYPWAERLALAGAADCGDISLLPGRAVIVEVKHYKSAAAGLPQPSVLAAWMRQTETERDNAGADVGVLVVKRAGTTDVGRWFAYVTADALGRLIGAEVDMPVPSAPMSTSVASLVAILRAAGYGEPWRGVTL